MTVKATAPVAEEVFVTLPCTAVLMIAIVAGESASTVPVTGSSESNARSVNVMVTGSPGAGVESLVSTFAGST
ncbi:hypothetical protein QMG83_13150 [Salinibacterium sp. G-O1]|uniref:hypothetical protein n=1 Tax=Salinibacterium sp. G-O1 TaxID=3046208 RepID=UPI0024BACAB5|nr:hypothetical protein [Salinibacterium sp. G-O1]MDJ0336172.1 hypothetical protein [Salinibacterium sp. G-O1]